MMLRVWIIGYNHNNERAMLDNLGIRLRNE
jgi:hypothetical protein